MDSAKKASFVKAMGRQRFARGGKVMRKIPKRPHFDDGGTVEALGGAGDSGVFENASNPNTGVMGSIGAALGLNNNFRASGADIQRGTNNSQLNAAYNGVQSGINGQQALANTLAPQAGTAAANQQALAQQYMDMTQGLGPNVAQNQLSQATANNVSNQAALMAGQRGASGNVGLMARQAAMQGANTQQQAVGQAATLGAQQQVAAQQNLQSLSNNQISQTGQAATGLSSAQQNEQSILQNANTSGNNAAVGMQSNINNVNAQTAAGNQSMAGNIMGAVSSAASALFAEGGVVEDHHKLAEMNARSYSHMKKYASGGAVEPDLGDFKGSSGPSSGDLQSAAIATPQASIARGADGGGGDLMGSVISGAISSGALSGLGFAEGGQVPNLGTMASSQAVSNQGPNIEATTPTQKVGYNDLSDAINKGKKDKKDGPEHSKNQTDAEAKEGYKEADAILGKHNYEEEQAATNSDSVMAASGGMIAQGPHKSHVANFLYAEGGRTKKVPAMVSPGEIYLSPEKVRAVAGGADPRKIGERIPGKAKVKGDSYANDTVPKTLEEGGVVIDRENVMSKDKARAFVHKSLKSKRGGK